MDGNPHFFRSRLQVVKHARLVTLSLSLFLDGTDRFKCCRGCGGWTLSVVVYR